MVSVEKRPIDLLPKMRHSTVPFERIVSEAFTHPFLTISSEHERVAPRRFHCVPGAAIGSCGSRERGISCVLSLRSLSFIGDIYLNYAIHARHVNRLIPTVSLHDKM